MIVVFALGIHSLLITIYGYMIAIKRSRLSFIHLALAVFLPFAGEICLLAAEAGKIPANPIYRMGLKKGNPPERTLSGWRCPDNWKAIILGEEGEAREFLMQAMDSADQRLPEILKTGLRSSSSEVSHISASRLMKMHRNYEDAIAQASAANKKMPQSMPLLAAYIDAVDAYRSSGLPDRLSHEALKLEELALLERYVRLMPSDSHYAARWKILRETEEET